LGRIGLTEMIRNAKVGRRKCLPNGLA